jgi:heat shock protein HslJ
MRLHRPIRAAAVLVLHFLYSGCAAPDAETQPTASLINTYWKLLSVDGQPVTVVENQREPHFVLHIDERRVAGYAGCNQLMGRYETDGPRLSFEDLGSTLMACEHGMETESAFLLALRNTARWKIDGERLEVFDEAGKSLAKFESVYLR